MVWEAKTGLITNNAKNKNAYYFIEAIISKNSLKEIGLRYQFYGYVYPCMTFWV